LRHYVQTIKKNEEQNMVGKNIQDRAAGAIMGAFIGDALGLGPHWYYNLAELRCEYGLKPGRTKLTY